jgi:hypothetical protein
MLAIIWIAVMLVAVVATYLLITDQLPEVVGPMIGIGLGFLLAYGAMNIEFATGGNELRSSFEPELALIGLSIVVVHAIYLVSDLVDTVDISRFTRM